jgi:hypothetical protein
VTAPVPTYRPAVGAADLTAEVCLGIALAERRSSDCARRAAQAPSPRNFGHQKRLARASQASRTGSLGSPLHSIRVPTQLIRVPRG